MTLCLSVVLCVFFFLQAEHGIRDLVRSRGLGDVYKRQALELGSNFSIRHGEAVAVGLAAASHLGVAVGLCDSQVRDRIVRLPVSYTPLTLPTSDLE